MSKQTEILKVAEKIKYGDYVQMDDRFETVHIWSEELEKKYRRIEATAME